MSERPPTELSPAKVNAKAIFLAGIIGWVVGILVLAGLHLAGLHPPGRYTAICVAGIVLGSIGYAWAYRLHLIDDGGLAGPREHARHED